MKKLYFSLILIAVNFIRPVEIIAQAYTPFPDTAAVWNVNNSYTDGMNVYYYEESIFFSGSINALGNTYKELSKNVFFIITPVMGGGGSSVFYSQSTGYALRQDVSARQVYAYNISGGTEVMFIDFNFQPGDTLSEANIIWGEAYGPDVFHITTVDSILIGTSYRRKYNFEGINGNVIMSQDTSIIEGIGSTSGLFWAPLIFEGFGHLECFSHFGNELYPTFSTTPCGIVSVNQNKSPKGFFVYADYAEQRLHVHISNRAVNYFYLMTDVTGNVISEGKLHADDNLIDIGLVSPGVYLVKLFSGENIFVQKFIKP